MKISMSSPDLAAADIQAVRAVLDTPMLSMGSCIADFETHFAAYIGSRFSVGVSSGTAGLHLAMLAAGVGDGDLVITTPFSFVASANCILYERAIPVFVDIDPETFTLDPGQVAQAAQDLAQGGTSVIRWLPPNMRVDDRPSATDRLRALLPVDVFGQPADYDRLRDVADSLELIVVEDACEALGAEYKGRRAGTLGDVAVFGFYPNKQMTTGEGGVVVTDREDWDCLLRSLRNQGRDDSGTWLNHVRLGYNYRLDELSAALGLAQLARIQELLAKRQTVAEMYRQRLKDLSGVTLPGLASWTTRASWFIYVICLAPEIDRSSLIAALDKGGVPSRPYFTPIHLQPLYRERFGYRQGDFPITERVASSTLALPFSGVMTEEQVEYVCTALEEALKRSRVEAGHQS